MLKNDKTVYRCIAKTLMGLEAPLLKELEDLGYKNLVMKKRAVEFDADLIGIYRANLELRTALSVLVNLKQLIFRDEKDIYYGAFKINWEDIFDVKKTFMIQATVYGDAFKNTNYPALVLKDGIVDRFRKKKQVRPSIDKERPDVVIDLYISDNKCTISINTSGQPLFKRGYRGMSFEAPLNECLAAGMILLSGWDKKENFVNPMCGSGTLLVEAAMMAYNIQAGALREEYAFMNWLGYDKKAFESLRRPIEDSITSKASCKLIGSDISRRALSITSFSLDRYKLLQKVELEKMDLNKAKNTSEKGVVILNPPYGERILMPDLDKTYEEIGDALKTHFQNHKAWIISSNIEALKHIGLKSSQKIDLMNGKLPCKFVSYELYEGSRRAEV
jgi:putative N6-adenine-specific DNA methylase